MPYLKKKLKFNTKQEHEIPFIRIHMAKATFVLLDIP
jgi:hypothetical protein